MYVFQTNGLCERFNQTLTHSLIKIVNESQNDWDEKISAVLFAYRVTKHKSTGYSPFYMLYHREARLPIDVELMPPSAEDEDVDPDDHVDAMLHIKDLVKSDAMSSISKAQDYQKSYYDSRHTCEVLL